MALRLGLVGRGRWGQIIERTLLSFPDVSVTAIAKGEAPPDGIDGVVIVTQSAFHAPAALPYIEAGIPTFIEKPMATTPADAARIRDAADRSGAPVFIGHIFLYNPAIRAALELLPSLGKLRYMLCEGMNDRFRADASVVWDWLPHHLSMARAIFGCDPGSVTAWNISGEPNPKTVVSRFLFGDATLVSTTSWLSPVPRKNFTLVGERATLVFDDTVPQRLTLHGADGGISHPAYSDEPPLTVEMGAFLQMVRSGAADASHLQTGTSIVRAIAAAEKSASLDGQTVTIA